MPCYGGPCPMDEVKNLCKNIENPKFQFKKEGIKMTQTEEQRKESARKAAATRRANAAAASNKSSNGNNNLWLIGLICLILLCLVVTILAYANFDKIVTLLSKSEPAPAAASASSPWLTGQKASAEQHAYRIEPVADDDCAKYWSQVAPVGTVCVVRQSSGLMTYSDVTVEGMFWPNWSNQSNLTMIAFGSKVTCPYGCSFMAAKPASGVVAPSTVINQSSTSGTCLLNIDNPKGYQCQSADGLRTDSDVVVDGKSFSGAGTKQLPTGQILCEFGCYLKK